MVSNTTEHSIAGRSLVMPRAAWVVHDAAQKAKVCLLWMDGELYSERVKAPEVISGAQSSGKLPPLACVYLPNASAADRHAIYTCNESFASFIALEMPGWIEREVGEFDRLFLCGLSLSGLQAVFTALRHPGVFSGVLAQSPSAWWQDERLVDTLVSAGSYRPRFWLSVGSQELRGEVSHPPTPLYQKASQRASVHRLAGAMSRAGHEVRLHEYEGGHNPECWGEELTRALDWLLLAPET